MIERASSTTIPILTDQALPALHDVVEKLRTGGLAADIGCGAGARTIAMARAFPETEWRGYDTSLHALARARQNVADAGLSNLSFHNPDEEPLPDDHSFDLVTFCDVVHDMAFPQEVLKAVHGALDPDGTVLVIDITVPEAVTDRMAHPVAPAFYGVSMAICMSSGMSEEGGAGLGPMALPQSVLQQMTTDAGFTRFRVTDVEDPFNSYYEIRP